jgi:hypothetical protein
MAYDCGRRLRSGSNKDFVADPSPHAILSPLRLGTLYVATHNTRSSFIPGSALPEKIMTVQVLTMKSGHSVGVRTTK